MFIFIIVLVCISCLNDELIKPDNKEEKNVSDEIMKPGIIHNEILYSYAEDEVLFLKKLSVVDAVKLFIASANKVLDNHGVQFVVTEKFVYDKLYELSRLKDKCGYDIFNPGNDYDQALIYFEEKKDENSLLAKELKSVLENIKEQRTIITEHYYSSLSDDALQVEPVIDIAIYSAIFWKIQCKKMDEYVNDHPELKSWWDNYKRKIREWAFIASDCIGGLAASGAGGATAIVGAALASIAFTIVWPPY
jgi:hypothetical protein